MHELAELGGLAATVAAAHEGGLLRALLSRAATPERHALDLGLDPGATLLVCEALRSLGIAEECGGIYFASKSLAALDRALPGGVAWTGLLWTHLPSYLRSGEPFTRMNGEAALRSEAYSTVVSSLANLFEEGARELAAHLDRRPRAILDVGAGSGVWSIAIAARSPGSRIMALDLPAVLPHFLERANALGLADRVATMAGDYREVAIPGGQFDEIILANVLHLESAPEAAALVEKMAAGLAPGGELVVVGGFAEDTPERDRARAFYSLHLAMRTEGGANHARADIESWCRNAGLRAHDLLYLDTLPRSHAVLLFRK